jgi:endonuclease-3
MAKEIRSQKPARSQRSVKPLGKAEIYEVFRRFHALNPEPKGELEYVNSFTLLVAVVLSAQATDAGVNKATRKLFELADTPEKMLALGEEKVRDLIKTIGLFRTKAKNVIAAVAEADRRFWRHGAGQTARRWSACPASAARRRMSCSTSPSASRPSRLTPISSASPTACRWRPGKTPEQVEAGLEKAVPDDFRLHCHHWLILHGRYLCKALKPECWRCPVADLCRHSPKTPAPNASAQPA